MPDRRSLWSDPAAREPQRGWFERPAPVPVPPPQDDPPPPRRSRLRTALIVAGTLAALALGGAAGALLAHDGGAPKRTAVKRSAASRSIGAIYAAVSPGVVQVRAKDGSGTGFVFHNNGTIVTNAHVVEGSSKVSVVFDDSGDPVAAEIVGIDQSSDLAVLKIDPADGPRLHAVPLGDSDKVHVGDSAIAIGYPLGLDRTVTTGIVSGLGREIKAPNGFSIDKVIQTDAAINPGNSGGPLLDRQGRLIGVNAQIKTAGTNGNIGIGFAIPSNTVKQVVPKLEAGQAITRPYLGVSTSDSPNGDGAVIRDVAPGGPADRAGLQASSGPASTSGDTIVAIEVTPITSANDVIDAIAARQPGEVVKVQVLRGGQRFAVDVTLGTRPASRP